MSYLLIVILEDVDRLPELLKAWKRIGVPGVTIMHSVGGFRAETWLDKIGFGGLDRLFSRGEIRQRTLFSIILDKELLEKAISEADEIVEGFDRPNSGILFSLPIEHTLGVQKRKSDQGKTNQKLEREMDNLLSMHRRTPVSEIVNILALSPIIVSVDAGIESIVSEVIAHPRVHVVCVVNDEKRLMGLIDLETLADALFFSIFPEEFLRELKGIQEVLNYAERTKVRYASDLMKDPIWVKMNDSLGDAFLRMHENKLPGLPVVDDYYHVINYINLLELMAVCQNINEEQIADHDK
jgi:nitrogen regulatory protein P-II 1